uniref:Shikimate kinase n=1 Tax=Fervidicoccus fontis TaxID=683846 RepID=A0A7J3ZJU9_9CREN
MNRATSVVYGAVSVLNAIPTGVGGAIGVNLKVKCELEIVDEPGVRIESIARGERIDVSERLVNALLEVLRERYGLVGGLRARVESEVPPARGLKSSSAFINALVVGALKAMRRAYSLEDVALASVEIARRAGLTITGALDDTLASLEQGVFITDNARMRILRHYPAKSEPVVIFVPREKLDVSEIQPSSFESLRSLYLKAAKNALNGSWREAMTLNGFLTALAIAIDPTPILRALKLPFTIAAGVTGKGPAFFAVTREPESIADLWSEMEGEIIITSLRGGGFES